MVVKGHRPLLAMVVEIEQVFFHCAKAFLRSRLWEPESWRPDAVPSRARIAHQQERAGEDLADIERYYGETYAAGLYPTGASDRDEPSAPAALVDAAGNRRLRVVGGAGEDEGVQVEVVRRRCAGSRRRSSRPAPPRRRPARANRLARPMRPGSGPRCSIPPPTARST